MPLRIGIARAGLPYVAPVAVAFLVAAIAGGWWLAVPLALAGAYLSFFFRDPERTPPAGEGLVLSPGDGKLVVVDRDAAGRVGMSIFLGLLDVHVNRAPADATVEGLEHVAGKFIAAFKPEAAHVNEQNRIRFRTSRGSVEMRQVVGLAARSLEFWKRVGDTVRAGERVGIMKIGSRIDLWLPAGSEVAVAVGARVRAGETVLARLPAAGKA